MCDSPADSRVTTLAKRDTKREPVYRRLEKVQPAKDLSRIKMQKELNGAERKKRIETQAHRGGRSRNMSFPGYAKGRTGS